MFFLMLKQSFFMGRRRKILAVLTVFLAAALITALLNLTIDVGDKMAQEMKSYGSNIRVLPKSETIPLEIGGVDYNPLKGRSFIEESTLPNMKEIFWRNNIVGLAPELKTRVDVGGREVALIGTWFDKNMPIQDEPDYRTGVDTINSFWQLDGRWPDDQSQRELLVGVELAQALDLSKGMNLSLTSAERKTQQGKVVGILTTGGAEDTAILAPLVMVQTLTGLTGKVSAVNVSALTIPENDLSRRAHRNSDALDSLEYDVWYCTAYVSAIVHQLEEAVPSVSAQPVWQVAASEGVIIEKIQLLLLVMTLAAFISSGMGISSLMSTTIMERSKEIGLMKALGAEQWEIFALFLTEAAVTGVIGGLLGVAVGTGLSQLIGLTIFNSTLSFHWILVPMVVVVSALISLAGSIMPARLIARLHPMEVLHGH